MRNLRFAVSALVLSSLGASATAMVFNSTAVGLLGGAADSNWTVSGPSVAGTQQAITLNYAGNPFPYNAYAANDAFSQWISFAADGGNSLPAASTQGIYTYTTTVDFTGSTGVLTGHVWSDNAIVDVLLGNVSLGLVPLATTYAAGSVDWFKKGSAFTLSGSGVQTVSFQVRNGFPGSGGSNDPTAFRARLSMQAVPEPFTMGLGLAAAGLFARRRLKSAARAAV